MRITNPVGLLGENHAVDFLKKKGYIIIERNFRKGYGEIDIVATKDNTLVFVEVKTRTSDAYGTPFEAITRRKLHELVKMAQFYKHTHPRLPDSMRIDAIGITLALHSPDKPSTIEHAVNISG